MGEGRSLTILGISGSLRRGSFNTGALRAAAGVAPPGVVVELAELRDIPLYDEDLRRERGFPPAVERLRARIRRADALLLATPEYNYSFTGVLKNAIDWVSRPPEPPLPGKPLAVIGVSPGVTGAIRAQWQLRPVLAGLGALVLFRPEVAIGDARAKFDENGDLRDADSRQRLAGLLEALVAWTRRLEAGAGTTKPA